jgi:hypothetical protein
MYWSEYPTGRDTLHFYILVGISEYGIYGREMDGPYNNGREKDFRDKD